MAVQASFILYRVAAIRPVALENKIFVYQLKLVRTRAVTHNIFATRRSIYIKSNVYILAPSPWALAANSPLLDVLISPLIDKIPKILSYLFSTLFQCVHLLVEFL